MILGALETGGTKFVCATGDENGVISDRAVIPTTSPEETLEAVKKFFSGKRIEALGIGSFGPLCLDKSSPDYGHITSTPKPGWSNTDIVSPFEKALGCPVRLDTDVNAAALGEAVFGHASGSAAGKTGSDNLLYVTIGTGIGVGVYIDGHLLHGAMHAESGHIFVARHPDDRYEGKCPFHKDCFEGLASGPAIEGRFGIRGELIPFKAPGSENASFTGTEKAWDIEAYYIAQACVNYTLCYSPKVIVLGGGVMNHPELFPMIRSYYKRFMNNYVKNPYTENPDSYIVPATLSGDQGILGCLCLAKSALTE